MLNLVVLQTSQPPGFARGWSVVPRRSKSAWPIEKTTFFLLYTVIRELMDASRHAILCLFKWLYRRVQVTGSQTSQSPGFARGASVVPRRSKSARPIEKTIFLFYSVIRELMDASRPASLCLFKWLYRRVQVTGSQVSQQGADRVETKGRQLVGLV